MEETVKTMLEELKAAYAATAAILVNGNSADHLAEVRSGLRRAHAAGAQALKEAGHGGPD